MEKAAYSALAACYDDLMGECDYAAQTAYVTGLISARVPSGKGVDLGCGSGVFTLAFAERGYRMTGVDLSAEMLTKARARLGNRPVSFFLQDVAALKLPEKYDFMTAVTDGFNYIPKKKAAGALRKMAAHLKPGGLLFLDLSSAYKLRNVLGDNLFGEDGEDLSYLWFNRIKEDCVEMDLSFFFKGKDGRYEKKEERHVQYIYEREEMEGLLSAAGFSLLSVSETYGKPFTETSERLNLLAVKK